MFGYNAGYSFKLFRSSLNRENLCSFSVADCTYEKDFSIENECSGRAFCMVNINKNRFKAYNPCKDFNYVQINYKCLPGMNINKYVNTY